MKRLKLLSVMISLPLVGCSSLFISDYCVSYEPFKIKCNKQILKDGYVCADVISEETINIHTGNELSYKNKCLSK